MEERIVMLVSREYVLSCHRQTMPATHPTVGFTAIGKADSRTVIRTDHVPRLHGLKHDRSLLGIEHAANKVNFDFRVGGPVILPDGWRSSVERTHLRVAGPITCRGCEASGCFT